MQTASIMLSNRVDHVVERSRDRRDLQGEERGAQVL
jgi:hypothetical protein